MVTVAVMYILVDFCKDVLSTNSINYSIIVIHRQKVCPSLEKKQGMFYIKDHFYTES